MELEEKGKRNGEANSPQEDSRDHDEVERAITERIESLRDDAYQVLEGHISTYGTSSTSNRETRDFDADDGRPHFQC
ncbi:hypothetical protein [Sinorhizobium meliloti]|uniref:hypothetical protein n=1 Tax=Rhizobium meliloti TaxID=382 RepID=UPI0020909F53|nr:hypothetical protein [Sinorhizobium meliloti]MCO5966037.1 hypothetical protein [Sinorhizobium meliloti]